MEIDVVQVELKKKYSLKICGEQERVYGIETTKEIFVDEIGRSNVEMAGVVCLDSTHKIINYSNIAIGDIEDVKVSVAQIIKVALLSNATYIVVAHNHPSGVLEITNADIDLTKHIGKAAGLFNIKLIDSLIVNYEGEILSIRENLKEIS